MIECGCTPTQVSGPNPAEPRIWSTAIVSGNRGFLQRGFRVLAWTYCVRSVFPAQVRTKPGSPATTGSGDAARFVSRRSNANLVRRKGRVVQRGHKSIQNAWQQWSANRPFSHRPRHETIRPSRMPRPAELCDPQPERPAGASAMVPPAIAGLRRVHGHRMEDRCAETLAQRRSPQGTYTSVWTRLRSVAWAALRRSPIG